MNDFISPLVSLFEIALFASVAIAAIWLLIIRILHAPKKTVGVRTSRARKAAREAKR